MPDSRALAVLLGAVSLALGVWSAVAGVPELAVAAGTTGLVAGLLAGLAGGVPRTTPPGPGRAPEPQGTEAPAPGGQGASAPQPGRTRGAVAPQAGPPLGRDAPGRDAPQLPGASLSDVESGLFSEDYLEVALDSRLASARRHLRPVALAVLQVTQGLPDPGADHGAEPGGLGAAGLLPRPGPADPSAVADAIRRTIRDSDIACRLRDGRFALVLEDTPESGAVWTVERVRRNLVGAAGHHTVWAGVACYPAHAFDAPELRAQAEAALGAAREWNQDRIEVATSE